MQSLVKKNRLSVVHFLANSMIIELFAEPFDPWSWLQNYQQSWFSAASVATGHKVGATNVFVGTMRDFNEGDDVQSMVLEHYPGMTEKHLTAIAQQALDQWDVEDIAIAHRYGEVFPGDALVCIVVWSSHRKAVYEANRQLMEDLKSKAPFWKKETLSEGHRWVAKNTEGY